MALSDDRLTVVDAPRSEVVGTVAWLRGCASRFSSGSEHRERRALVVGELDPLEPALLRSGAFQRAAQILRIAGEAGHELDVMSSLARQVPMATLASALGFNRSPRLKPPSTLLARTSIRARTR